MKARSAVLVVRDDKVLLIERKKQYESVFYVLPGGGIEDGETPEQAAIREMQEELGVDITIKKKEIDPLQTDRETWIIHAEIDARIEVTWIEKHRQTPLNQYKVIWLAKDEMKGLRVFPENTINVI